jgi:hypothetical protein
LENIEKRREKKYLEAESSSLDLLLICI